MPIRAKGVKPIWVWIQPPTHVNFRNNNLRLQFGRALEKCATYFDRMHALKLVKHWESDNTSLFNKEDQKFTALGYQTYWMAVDKVVKYTDTLLLKKSHRVVKEKQDSQARPTESARSAHISHHHHLKRSFDHHRSSLHRDYIGGSDRYHWHRNSRPNRSR